MAGEFYPAALQLQYPDLLRSYVQGQQGPLVTQGLQQENTERGLKLDQLRQIMNLSRQISGQAGGAQNQGGNTGGIQNGPQGQVSSQPPSQSGSYDGSIGMPPVNTMMALDVLQGRDPLQTAKSAQEYELKQRQLQAQAPLATLDSIAGSASPARVVMNNPGLIQRWTQLAPQLGLDPVKDFNDDSVRSVIGFARNQIAGAAGLPTKEVPLPLRPTIGPFGYRGQIEPITGKETQVQGREMPVKVGERQDPNTGQMVAVYQNWAGGPQAGSPATTAAGAPGAPAGTTEVPVGQPAPSPDQTRAAGLAMSMRTGLDNLRRLEQKGFAFTPADRAAVVGVISEQGGPLGLLTGGALSSLPLQELLAHKLSPEGQTYLASLMPVLQGIGHHLGGQRLNDVQIKALLESIAPINTKNQAAMQQINANRNGYYSGLLLEAGPARESPVFGGALKADYAKFAAPKTVTQAQVADYAQTHRMTFDAARRHVEANGFTVQ